MDSIVKSMPKEEKKKKEPMAALGNAASKKFNLGALAQGDQKK